MSLRDRFFEPTDVVSDLQWVRSRVLDANAPEGERSHGHITTTDLMYRGSKSGRRPARGGIFCQKIFGPDRRYECGCSRVKGEEHAGSTCERCGVLCSMPSLRDLRYGHLEVAGVFHPALTPLVATALGLSPEQVRAIARCVAWLDGDDVIDDMDSCQDEGATGPTALKSALEQAGADASLVDVAVTQAIPVPPPGMRPFSAGLSPAMVDPWIGPLNEAWRTMVERANKQLRLMELDAPPILSIHEQGAVQRLFESLVKLTVAPPTVTRLWPEPEAPTASVRLMGAPGLIPDNAGTEVQSMIFVDDDRLFVQRPRGSWLVATSGAVLAHFPTSGRIATSVHGSRLCMPEWFLNEWDWFDQDTYWEAKSGRASVAVLDLETGKYLSTYPEDLPRRRLENDQPEDLVVASVEAACTEGTGDDESLGSAEQEAPAALRWGGDRPGVLATTRDGRFAWVGEQDDTAILDLDTGIPLFDPVMQADTNDEDPTLLLSPEDEDVSSECECGEYATALGVTPDDKLRFLHGTAAVSDGEALWFRINATISAGAFSPTADRLAIATGEEIVIVSVSNEPSVLARFPAPGGEAEEDLEEPAC